MTCKRIVRASYPSSRQRDEEPGLLSPVRDTSDTTINVGPVRLFRDEIAELDALFRSIVVPPDSDATKAARSYMEQPRVRVNDHLQIDTIDDLEAIHKTRLKSMTWSHSRLTVRLTPQAVTVRAWQNTDMEVVGGAHAIARLLTRSRRPLAYLLTRPWFLWTAIFGGLALNVTRTTAVRGEPESSIWIAVGLTMSTIGMVALFIWVFGQGRLINRWRAKLTFWERNRDALVSGFIYSLLAAIVGGVVVAIVSKT
jgi:hypothetical protein